MARINVDDCIYGDIRFRRLCRMMKNEDEALGLLIRFWRTAQTYYADGKMIPEAEFHAEKFDAILSAGLAEKFENSYYAKGSERFDWYKQKHNASKAAAIKRKRASPKKDSGVPKHKSRKSETLISEVPLIDSTPLNSSLINSIVTSELKTLAVPKKTDGAIIWESYEKAYREKYQVDPVRNAKQNKHCSDIAKRIALAEAPDVIRFYISHKNAYYVREGHSLQALVKDCEKIRMEWATGRKITASSSNTEDLNENNVQAVRAYLGVSQ